MADQIRVKVEGGKELVLALRRMGVDVGEVLEAAALAGGQVLARAANPNAPEPLCRAETAKRTATHVEVDVGFPKEKWHWVFRELGATAHEETGTPMVFEGDQGTVVTGGVDHPGHAATPFLRPAFDGKNKAAADSVGATLDEAIHF